MTAPTGRGSDQPPRSWAGRSASGCGESATPSKGPSSNHPLAFAVDGFGSCESREPPGRSRTATRDVLRDSLAGAERAGVEENGREDDASLKRAAAEGDRAVAGSGDAGTE